MARTYTDDEKVAALAALEVNAGNASKTSRELGIPRPTLLAWKRDLTAVEQGVRAALTVTDTEDEDAASPLMRWLAVQSLATTVLAGNLKQYQDSGQILEPSDLRHVATIAGIAADKHLDYRDGRKGSEVNIHNDNRTLITSEGRLAR